MLESKLSNAPLKEAILELRWELDIIDQYRYIDPFYDLIVGRMFEKNRKEYPVYERLQSAEIPNAFSPYQVKQRFRAEKDGWPLFQVGPGVLTLNFTEEKYDWETFFSSAKGLISDLYEFSDQKIKFHTINLSYLDEIFLKVGETLLSFLKDKMKIDIRYSDSLFDNVDFNNSPIQIVNGSTFTLPENKGAISFQISSQNRNDETYYLTKIIYSTIKKDIKDKNQSELFDLISFGHIQTHNWFYNLIDGDLRKEYEL
jgi:uncharacterized protein (TIGR04255 family)